MRNDRSQSLRDRLLALAAFERVLSAPRLSFGRWIVSEPDADGVIQMPWYEYGAEADAFHRAAAANGWVVAFDWMAWAASPEGRRLIGDPALVAQASALDLQRLLTACIRGDRFIEGNIAAAFESGMLLAIVRRAAELAIDDASHTSEGHNRHRSTSTGVLQMAPDPDRIRAFAESYAAAWCSMDPTQVAAHYAPDGSLAINGGTPSVGREALTATAQSFYTALPDMQVYLRDVVIDGDRIEFHWRFTGTNTGPGGTGNAVRVDGFEAWTLDEDGLIKASIGTYDADEYARQLEFGVDA